MRFNDLGERFLLSRIGGSDGIDTGIDVDILLFTNDYVLDNDDFDIDSFDEVSGGSALWYSRKRVNSWNTPGTTAGVSSMSASNVKTWTSDGSASVSVYGYALAKHATDDVIAAEKFIGPVIMDTAGSVINILLALSLRDDDD